MELPEKYLSRQNDYMQVSDSDDDDKPDRVATRQSKSGGHGGNKKKGAATPTVVFKHDKPIIRERPESAKALHSISANDPEFKVDIPCMYL